MVDDVNDRKVNPNTASVEQLTSLPGVGEALAGKIRAGRPYQTEAELLEVSGVGDALLQRIAPRLTFENDDADQSPQPAVSASGTALARRPVERPATHRPNILLWCLATALVSVLVSVGLTLAILLSINGTLNMGRHARVQQLGSEMASLQGELADAQSQLASADQQLQALSGLSGRMSAVEATLTDATTRMEDARQRVDEMQAAVDELDAASQRLTDRADRFDQFLDGLRQLLDVGPDSAGSDAGSQAPPIP